MFLGSVSNRKDEIASGNLVGGLEIPPWARALLSEFCFFMGSVSKKPAFRERSRSHYTSFS